MAETLTPDDRSIWKGSPVECPTCGQAGVPVHAEDGWRLPAHDVAYRRRGGRLR